MKKTLLLLSGMIIVNSVFAQSDTKLSLRITQEARDFIADYYKKAEKEVPLPAHPEETLIKMIQGSSIWHPESFVFGDFLPAFFTKIRIEAENKNLLSVTDYTKSDWWQSLNSIEDFVAYLWNRSDSQGRHDSYLIVIAEIDDENIIYRYLSSHNVWTEFKKMSLIAFKHQWGNRALVDLFNNAFHKNALLDKQKLIKDLTELAHKLVYQDPDKKLWRIFSLKGDNLDVQTSQGNFELAKDIQQWYKNRESQEELNTLCRKWGIPDIIMLDIVGQRISPTFQVK